MWIETTFAITFTSTSVSDKQTAAVATSSNTGIGGFFANLLNTLWSIIVWIFIGYLTLKLIRLAYEIVRAKNLVYMRVMLPRADSKLDKEQDTKKDFKEKIGIMTLFYKSIHMIGQISATNTIMNFIFGHAKVSLEMTYDHGQVYFYIVAYREHMTLIVQQVTSNYPDAEVKILKASDMPDIKPRGYVLEAASIGKQTDDVFPIKTYKYFEDDPLSSYTNNFGSLKKTDVATIQWIIKPLGARWNRRAKDAARLVAKGEYRKGMKFGVFTGFFQTLLAPFRFLIFRFIKNEAVSGDGSTTHPGASGGDAYKIFNQAETEAQKMVGESAGQP